MTLIVRPGYGGAAVSDPDAQAYLQAVEVADNQALEQGVQQAVNQFVIGCKADGIWTAIKASCILSGARTLTGALVPLVGTAPTNVNFVSGDYNRKTGLVGASTKNLNANRAGNADPQNNMHNAIYASTTISNSSALINSNNGAVGCIGISWDSSFLEFRGTNNNVNGYAASPSGLVGLSRQESASFTARFSGANQTATRVSQTPTSAGYTIFSFNNLTGFSTARLAFYSIGESLDLALLDARVSALITAFGVAIP